MSLGKCLKRLLDQWEPLLSFFLSETKKCGNRSSLFLESYKIPTTSAQTPKTPAQAPKTPAQAPNTAAQIPRTPAQIAKTKVQISKTAAQISKAAAGHEGKESIDGAGDGPSLKRKGVNPMPHAKKLRQPCQESG